MCCVQATGPIQVRWYHSQNRNPTDAEELDISSGGRYTVEESELLTLGTKTALKVNYSEGDSGSYWCRIVIGGDTPFSFWTVQSISGPTRCGPGSEQTDPKCAGQIAPILAGSKRPLWKKVVYAVVDSTTVESPSQYDKLQ